MSTPRSLIDRCRPIREVRKPPECGYQAPCWVNDPYLAIGAGVRCRGCGGSVVPQQTSPTRTELAAVGILR